MVRRSPLKLVEGRVITTVVRPSETSTDNIAQVEVAKADDTEAYRVRLSFNNDKAATVDLDTFRGINRAVESLVNAHHKRNGKAKAGKGKGNVPGSA